MGIKIKELRNKYCLTQAELAEAVDVEEIVIKQYESGMGRSNLELLCKLAIALNTSTDYLLGLTDTK